jgi:hypothetical protein
MTHMHTDKQAATATSRHRVVEAVRQNAKSNVDHNNESALQQQFSAPFYHRTSDGDPIVTAAYYASPPRSANAWGRATEAQLSTNSST